MDIADVITDVAEDIANREYGKSLDELDKDELKEIILIAENEVLGT
tara:strand:+ start:629 stop:766 length:138 start_codon:yes stop_codon:yes gene_type:complete